MAVVEVVLPLDREGVYWFEVTLDGESRAFFPLHVETLPGGTLHQPV